METIENSLHKDNYYLFVDESGTETYKRLNRIKRKNKWDKFKPDPNDVNFFSLVGVLIESNLYIDRVIPIMKSVKKQLYNNSNVALHLADMLSGSSEERPEFSKYKGNGALFVKDMQYILNQIDSINLKVIILHVNKVEMLNKYIQPANPYEFAPTYIMERVAWFIDNNKLPHLPVRVWYESRSGRNKGKKGKTTKDSLLKEYMVNELKLDIEVLESQSHFPRFSSAVDKIRSLRWHFHPIPKDIDNAKGASRNYFLSKYSIDVLHDLAHGIHLADIFISARRKQKEYNALQIGKYDDRVQIINDFLDTRGVIERIYPY